MITINLKPGAKRSKSGKSPLAASLARVKSLGEQIKDPYRLGALVLGTAWLGFVGVSHLSTSAELSDLEPKLEQARAEYQRFRGFLGEKRRLEAVRDSILAQVNTIRSVDGDRYVWPHILDEVARAVPPFTWLTDIAFLTAATPPVADSLGGEPEIPPVQIQVTGRTVDLQGYTRLLRQLEDSPYLADVTAISANTIIEQERAVTAFVLKATFARPHRAPALLEAPATAEPTAVAQSGGE
ncbi:MAG: PilN domain-containing protein [Gemmatimonadales bacterium]